MCFGPEAWNLRKLYAHVKHLGPHSATARHLDAAWGPEHELLATIAEILHASLRMFLAANGGKKIPDQMTIPRPEGIAPKAEPPAPVTLESVRSIFLGGVASE